MKIANIVSTNQINVSDEFNVVKSMDEIIHGLPTLIIGFDYVNKHYPDFNITTNKISDNLYWIFKKTEKRDEFQDGLDSFKRIVYNDLTKNISYVFIDPIQYDLKKIKKIISKIKSIKNLYTYITGDMAYIYGENIIFGVDLGLLRYMSLDVDKIKDKIKRISFVFLDDDKILIEYKKNVDELIYKVKHIPFLYSILNEKNDTISHLYISRES